ncbi:hypothetical protein MKW92_001035 [Papaver armeniacum]|nr:hypothetical protein MKW92_001035 [Papaver armeniacum]
MHSLHCTHPSYCLMILMLARSGYNTNPDEIQLRIDPVNDLNEEVSSLIINISLLKNDEEIGNEAKYQNDLISQLNNMKWINTKIIQNRLNHVIHVILFVFLCFFMVYFLSQFSGR